MKQLVKMVNGAIVSTQDVEHAEMDVIISALTELYMNEKGRVFEVLLVDEEEIVLSLKLEIK